MPEKRRLDYLKECNEYAVPLDQFGEQFCSRCQQPECTRSQYGTAGFDQRVSTWLERLFTEVPRMEPSDPRFGKIQAQKFFMVEPSLGSVTTSGWDMPDLGVSTEGAPASVKEEAAPIPAAALVVPDPTEAPSDEATEQVPSTTLHRNLLLMNTPAQPGRMLQGGVPLTKPGGKVAWQAPAPSDAPIVKPGGRVKLGG